MRFFPLKLPAIDSLFGASPRRQCGRRSLGSRKPVFETLSPRAMLSGHGLSGHMVSAASVSHVAQPSAVYSAGSHSPAAAAPGGSHTGSTSRASVGGLLRSGTSYSGGPTMFSMTGTLTLEAATLEIVSAPSNFNGGTLLVSNWNTYTGGTSTALTPGGTINIAPATPNLQGGTLQLQEPASTGSGATLTTPGTLTLGGGSLITAQRVQFGSTLNTGTGVVAVNGGTLSLDSRTTLGTGVASTVDTGATLELAGSVSTISNWPPRVQIANNSTTTPIVGAGNTDGRQQVGMIDGSGSTVVSSGSDLTANHIIQNALVIDPTSPIGSTVTIAASDSSGNPLANGPTLAGSLGGG